MHRIFLHWFLSSMTIPAQFAQSMASWSGPGSESRILIADWNGETLGLLVDRVADAISVEAGNLAPAPPNLHGVQMQKLRGVFRSGERLAALLDLASVPSADDRLEEPPREELLPEKKRV